MAKSRLFVVKDVANGDEFLVNTSSGAKAVGLVVGDRFDSKPADIVDVTRLVNAGQKIIEEPVTPPKEPLPPESWKTTHGLTPVEAVPPPSGAYKVADVTDTQALPFDLDVSEKKS